jgi:hypothetical protein
MRGMGGSVGSAGNDREASSAADNVRNVAA